MRFSIYLNPQTRGPQEDVAIIETTIEQAVRATTAGVQGVALTEHHFSGYNTYGNNFMLASHLCALAPRETTFLLAVAVPPLHNPLRLAQSATLLDILARGNVIVGFAPGGSPVEYAGLGREPSVRHEQMLHNLEVMERALAKLETDPPYEWETAFEHGSLRTRIMPGLYRPAVVRFARATQNDDGVIWTGKKGWYLFTARETPDVIESRLSSTPTRSRRAATTPSSSPSGSTGAWCKSRSSSARPTRRRWRSPGSGWKRWARTRRRTSRRPGTSRTASTSGASSASRRRTPTSSCRK